jgi:hypothetical protein
MSDAFWIDESRGIFGRDHDLYFGNYIDDSLA